MTVKFIDSARPCPHARNAITLLNSLIDNASIYVIEVGRNGNVTSLEICGTTSSILPTHFSSLFPELSKFALRHCRTMTDVSSVGGMRKLTELSLTDCRELRGFPRALCEGLQRLVVSRCPAFDCNLNLRNLKGLEILLFEEDNDKDQVPFVIWSLSNLKRLDLSGSRLTGVPKEIGNLKHLEELQVSGPNITSVSPEIRALAHLKSLDFYHLKVTELPHEMGELTALRSIVFRCCRALKRIPTLLWQLPHLQYLSLFSCCDLLIPARDVLECTDSLVGVHCQRSHNLLKYMVRLNNNGRYLLKEKDVSLALWGSAICHWSKNMDSLFYFLKQKPDLIPKSSRKREFF